MIPDHRLTDGTTGSNADTVEATTLRLRAAGCVSAADEATLFVDAAPDPATLERWIQRRERGEPTAWITGTSMFCDRVVAVEPGVFVPRPWTEALARRASSALREFPPGRRVAVDLCTGSGAIAAHLRASVPGSVVVGVDVDPAAVRCARRNDVAAVVGDLGGPLRSNRFSVVTAVPPYVPTGDLRLLPADVVGHEPRNALDGGADGLSIARDVVATAARLLRTGGRFFLELGGDQLEELGPHLVAHDFDEIEPWFDLDNDLRGVAARRTDRRRRSGSAMVIGRTRSMG